MLLDKTINTTYALSQDKVAERIDNSFSKVASLPSTSHNDVLHHIVAKKLPKHHMQGMLWQGFLRQISVHAFRMKTIRILSFLMDSS